MLGVKQTVALVELSKLGPSDPPPVRVENGDGSSDFLLVSEHAGAHIPSMFGGLGVPPEDLAKHIAYDIGALAVARSVSKQLDAVLIHQPYSRLLVDCNRPPFAPDSIPEKSEDIPIPGNRNLTDAAAADRRRMLFHPFHERIGAELTARDAAGRPTYFVTIHSFTPVYHGFQRPWHVGIQYGRDPRFAGVVMDILNVGSSLTVGDNVPYPVTDVSHYTIPFHAESRGYPHAMIEIRQDLVESPDGQVEWADRLAEVLTGAQSSWMASYAA